MSGISRSVAIGLLSALGAFASLQPAITRMAPQVQMPVRPVLKRRSNGFASYWNYRTGPGWSVAQIKRMAKKARNQKRHRKAMKGGAA